MPYNRELNERIKNKVRNWENIELKKMFGGTGFLLNGNMCFGVYKDFLILRLGEEKGAGALNQIGVRVFDITGRPMKGWVMVENEVLDTDVKLAEWLNRARDFVLTLPAK